MGVLKVRCPESGREVSTGIEIDPQSFAALPDKLPVSNCPLCGLDHAWLKWRREVCRGDPSPGFLKPSRPEVASDDAFQNSAHQGAL